MPTGDPPICRCGYGPISGCHCCSHTGRYQFTPTPGPWECPKCGSIYGPQALECTRCNPLVVKITGSAEVEGEKHE